MNGVVQSERMLIGGQFACVEGLMNGAARWHHRVGAMIQEWADKSDSRFGEAGLPIKELCRQGRFSDAFDQFQGVEEIGLREFLQGPIR